MWIFKGGASHFTCTNVAGNVIRYARIYAEQRLGFQIIILLLSWKMRLGFRTMCASCDMPITHNFHFTIAARLATFSYVLQVCIIWKGIALAFKHGRLTIFTALDFNFSHRAASTAAQNFHYFFFLQCARNSISTHFLIGGLELVHSHMSAGNVSTRYCFHEFLPRRTNFSMWNVAKGTVVTLLRKFECREVWIWRKCDIIKDIEFWRLVVKPHRWLSRSGVTGLVNV